MTSLPINQDQAKAHLKALGYQKGDRIFLRKFPPKKVQGYPKNYEFTLPVLPKLQDDDGGLYVCVNGGPKDENVTQFRAIFFEFDDRPIEDQVMAWQQAKLPEPTIQILTRKSVHTYYTLSDDCTEAQWRELQEDLLDYLGADVTLKNPSRVMRLAGAWHIAQGEDPMMCEIIHQSGQCYSYAELRAIVPRLKKLEPQLNPVHDSPLSDVLHREILPRLSPEQIYNWNGHNWKRDRNGKKYRGCCPWHESQTGTAFYSDFRDGIWLWRCPSCEIGGTAIEYRHRLNGGNGHPKGKDFVDIVKNLANEAGVTLPEFKQQPSASVATSEAVDPKMAAATLDDRAERLKNELQFYLKEPDPIKRLILRNDVCANYRISKQDFSDQIADLEESNNPKQRSKFDGISFFGGTTEAIDYYVSRYLPVGEAILLCSDAGVGKSALITDMIHASLSGGEFLGERVKHPGKVLVISSDESPRSTRRRFIARGIDLLDLSRLDVWTRLDITRLDDLEQYLEDKRPDVVFIDSITTVCLNVGISEKDPEFARYLYKLKNLVNRYGASLVVIHHANKDPLAKGIRRISGSARIPAAFWGVYLLESADPKNPDMPDRILEMVKGREVETFKSKITFHQRHEWQERGIFSVVDESGKEREYRSRANQVIEVLKRCTPKGMEYAEISAEVGLNGNYLYKVLDRLEDSRVVGKRRSEVDKRRWVYFICCDDTPSLPVPEMTNNFELIEEAEEEYVFDESEETADQSLTSAAAPSENYSSSSSDSGRGCQNSDRHAYKKGDAVPQKMHRNPSLLPDARSVIEEQRRVAISKNIGDTEINVYGFDEQTSKVSAPISSSCYDIDAIPVGEF